MKLIASWFFPIWRRHAEAALHSKKETKKTQQDEANRSNLNQVFILVNIV